MLRSSVVRCTVALPLLLTGCAGGQHARLDAHGLALGAVAGDARATVRPAEATAGAARSAAVADHGLELRLRRELAEKEAKGGAAVLEVIEPGLGVESRLRFALSRMLLGRGAEAAAALNALTVEVPTCALAWLLLGQVRAEQGDATAAVTCLRRTRVLEQEQAVAPHPLLDFMLARALLQTDEVEEGVRLLREQLAAGSQRVRAAELLAQVQGETGDFEGALAALDAVLDDVPDEPSLVLAKAELLGDQLRHDEAVALLDAHGSKVARPAMVQRRALLLRQRGELATALAVLSKGIDELGGDPANARGVAELQATRAEMEKEQLNRSRSNVRIREILGLLRYARQPIERVEAVRVLCKNAPPPAVQAAVRWALRDPHDAVRVAAIQAGLPHCDNPADLLATGLQDNASPVRSAAAAAATRQPARLVFPLLVAAIAREADADAFRSLHRALGVVSGQDLDLPFDGERSEAIRARVAGEWRRRLEQVGKEHPGS